MGGGRRQRGGGFTLRLACLLGVVSLRCLVVCKCASYVVQLTNTFVSCITSLAHLQTTRHRKEASICLETASGMSCWRRLHRASTSPCLEATHASVVCTLRGAHDCFPSARRCAVRGETVVKLKAKRAPHRQQRRHSA